MKEHRDIQMLPRSLEKRVYRFKSPATSFYCPLCATPRAITVKPTFSAMNYIQMGIATIFLMLLFYPLMGLRSSCVFFLVWGCFEATLRLRFSKEVPCPHCGFDASWYKRDVKEARRRVEVFWKDKQLAATKKPA